MLKPKEHIICTNGRGINEVGAGTEEPSSYQRTHKEANGRRNRNHEIILGDERNKRVPRDEMKVKMAMYFKNMVEELFEEGLGACNHEDEGEGVGGRHKFL